MNKWLKILLVGLSVVLLAFALFVFSGLANRLIYHGVAGESVEEIQYIEAE